MKLGPRPDWLFDDAGFGGKHNSRPGEAVTFDGKRHRSVTRTVPDKLTPDEITERLSCRYPLVDEYLTPDASTSLAAPDFRVCSAEGEWLHRLRGSALVAGRTVTPEIEHDVQLLSTLVPEASSADCSRNREAFRTCRLGTMDVERRPSKRDPPAPANVIRSNHNLYLPTFAG